jgi:putative membrane protein
MNIAALLLGTLLGAIVAAILIWIVGKLGLGMQVDGFGPALLTGLLYGVLSAVIHLLLGLVNFAPVGFWFFLTNLAISTVALLLAAQVVKGVRVGGFLGALIAVLGMAGLTWLFNWLIGLIL